MTEQPGKPVKKRGRRRTYTLDADTGKMLSPDVKQQRTSTLRDLQGVKREMARTFRHMKSGAIQADVGAKLIYALRELGVVISAADLEARVEQTAKQVGELRARIEELRVQGLPVKLPQLAAPEEGDE